MKKTELPKIFITGDIHVDKNPDDPNSLTEIDCGRETGLIRILPAKIAHDFYKRNARIKKREDKALGKRWSRRTFKSKLRKEIQDEM